MRKFFSFLAEVLSLKIGATARDIGEFRAHQLSAVLSVTPLMMASNFINSTIIAVAFSGKSFAPWIYAWALLIYFMAGAAIHSWNKSRSRPFPTKVSARGLRRLARNSTILGFVWGMVPLIAFPGGDLMTKMVVVAFVGGMMGGGCLSLYMIPAAMLGFLSGMASTFLLALFLDGETGSFVIGALTMMYFVCLYAAGMAIARTFAESKISEGHIEEQASIISLLLRDFEDSASDWLWETDKNNKMTRGIQRFNVATGIAEATIEQILFPEVLAKFSQSEDFKVKGFGKLLQHVHERTEFKGLELSITDLDNKECWLSLNGKPQFNKDDSFIGFRGVASNVTEEKQSKERIAFLAHNDALTGLVNRINFSQAIEQAFKSRRVATGGQFSVFYLDLDGFKLVNDTKGHKVGDKLLVQVGQRLKRILRDYDVVARLGGDEFAILVRHESSTQVLTSLAEKIIETIDKPFDIDGNIVTVGVSIGIAIGLQDGNDVETLLNSADLALYRAKEEGKGTFRLFETKMDDVVRDRRLLEQELRSALVDNQFELHFQPLVSAMDGITTGFEALIRWNHPTRGQVSPTVFIPIAERTGAISEIGDWVLMEACKTAVGWPDHMTISVNLSPQQFLNRRVVASTRNALQVSGLPPHRLELEITESLFVDNTEEAVVALNELKQLGVMTSLDDFGTGYSSLSYLLKFPFDKLKIDQSFIKSIERDKTARDILETIAKLGNILNLSVTAEGVETAEQAMFLSTMACNQMQGFHFGRPIPSDKIPAFLLAETSRQLASNKAITEAAIQHNILLLDRSAS